MNINVDKIKDIYGIDTLNLIKDNIKDIVNNIKYLEELGFSDVEDIFERYTLMFIYSKEEFKEKINYLINKLGNNYVEIIENDLGILEELL